MFSPHVHRLQKRGLYGDAVQITRQCLRIAPGDLIRNLAALGNVLYMPMHDGAEQMEQLAPGFLVEAMLLAPLTEAQWLVMASMITVDGPREWVECVDADHRPCARIHLLPDTDYLAWDALLGCGDPVVDLQASASTSKRSPASAQILRFHTCRLAGLQILGARLATTASTLSRYLADRIARDEALSLQLAASR